MPSSRGAEDDGPRGEAGCLNDHTRPAWSDATSAGLANAGPARPLRVVQVGTGGMGKYWCRSVWPHVARVGKAEVVAAVDVVPEHFVHATTQLGLPPERCYPSLAAAFGDIEADVVAVVVPPGMHEEVIGVALDHGCDVLSEKPLADTMDACCRVAAKVEQTGRKMAVTMNHRFDQDKQSLEAAIHGGEYGRLSYLVHRFTDNCPKFGDWGAAFRHRMADPLLIEGSVHHLDMLRALARSNARSVYARTWNPPWGEYGGDTTALVSIEMDNGVRAFYEGSLVSASTLNGWDNDYVRAECEHGTLELDRRRLRVLTGAGPEPPSAADIPLLAGEVWTHELLAELFCDWVSGVRDDHPTSVADNMQACALLFAALESAHTGEPVDVQAFLVEHQRAAAV